MKHFIAGCCFTLLGLALSLGLIIVGVFLGFAMSEYSEQKHKPTPITYRKVNRSYEDGN